MARIRGFQSSVSVNYIYYAIQSLDTGAQSGIFCCRTPSTMSIQSQDHDAQLGYRRTAVANEKF